MSIATRKLLIIACSDRKIRAKDLLPAIERYDGVNYRVIHKMQREGRFPPNVDVKILSAKFGLIDASTPISYYDQRMDRQRAAELRPSVLTHIQRCLAETRYSEIYVDLGADYLPAIELLVVPYEAKFMLAEGRIGERLANLKRWLTAR